MTARRMWCWNFWISTGGDGAAALQYLVFDSKFTTYQSLGRLNAEGVKFLTIRRRGRNLVADIKALPDSDC